MVSMIILTVSVTATDTINTAKFNRPFEIPQLQVVPFLMRAIGVVVVGGAAEAN